MKSELISRLNKFNKTGIYTMVLNNEIDENFGNGKLDIYTLKIKEIVYQFIICQTKLLRNRLIFRYYNKTWSHFFNEPDFINNSEYKFIINLNNNSNKNYLLLKKHNINNIYVTSNNKLFVNNKNTRKD